MKTEQIHKKALLHLRLRWLGLPLFFSGLILFCLVLTSLPMSRDYFALLLGFGSAGSGLTIFGVNHDTAMAYAVSEYPDTEGLHPSLLSELEEDLEWNQASILSLTATPKSAFFIPVIAIAIQLWLFSRLSCHFGLNVVGELCKSPWFGA